MDVYKSGARKNGIYFLNGNKMNFPVFCDFQSEANFVWTLATSYALKNLLSFRKSLSEDVPRNECNPNWEDYRLVSQIDSTRECGRVVKAQCFQSREVYSRGFESRRWNH